MRKTGILISVITIGLVLTACGGGGTTTTPAATPPAAATPQLTFKSPVAGAQLPSGNVYVTVALVSDIALKPPSSTNVPRQGHLHYYKDVADIPTTPGKPAVSAPGTYVADTRLTVIWENVTPGTHTFGVQLVNNDHTPLSPPVTAKVTVTVTAPAPK